MSAKRFGIRFAQILMAAVVAIVVVASARADSLCGIYATAPGSTVQYEYLVGGSQVEVLPLVAQLMFSCDNPTRTLEARLESPIIGVDENGNVIFPIGGQFPMTALGESLDGRRFTGSLLDTPYFFSWDFDRRPSGALTWSGSVDWTGGRYEHTTIAGVELTPVPEPAGLFLMMTGLFAAYVVRWRALNGLNSQLVTPHELQGIVAVENAAGGAYRADAACS
jgi:hypothetical protein